MDPTLIGAGTGEAGKIALGLANVGTLGAAFGRMLACFCNAAVDVAGKVVGSGISISQRAGGWNSSAAALCDMSGTGEGPVIH